MSSSSGSASVLARALVGNPKILAHLKPGKKAMTAYSTLVKEVAYSVSDGVDFDEATRPEAPQEPRWDYVLGAARQGAARARTRKGDLLVAVEVHSATDREVAVVIRKKQASKPRLDALLKTDAPMQRWVWIASGKVKFSPNSSYRRRLAEARIEFAGRGLVL